MDSFLRRAALIAILAGAGSASAQRRSRTLSGKPQAARVAFSDLIDAQAARELGGLERLPQVRGANPVQPAVYVTISRAAVQVWDQETLRLAPGAQVPRGALASCPPVCIPDLRDQVARAVHAEAMRLARGDHKERPRVLLIADQAVPMATFLAVAYSLAHATAESTPDLQVAVRSAEAPDHAAQIAFLLSPPRPIKIAENANPLVLHVNVEPGRYVVAARKSWLPWPEAGTSIAAVMRLAGELKARDTNKTIAFVTAPPGMPIGRVIELMGALRTLYPNLVLGGLPKVMGPAE
jgi:hypothetical protein